MIRLEGALLDGTLAAGDSLPGERELASGFGVSRTSVREALRVLEALGLVDINRGADGASLRDEPGDAFAELLRLHIALGHYELRSVIELRIVVESASAARLASDQSTSPARATLASIVDRMFEPSLTLSGFQALDMELHDQLVLAGGNQLMALTLRGCRSVIYRLMLDGFSAGEWASQREQLAIEHRELLGPIWRNDPARASRAVEEHIRRWSSRPNVSTAFTGPHSIAPARGES